MTAAPVEMSASAAPHLTSKALRAANVDPGTGLATDYLNHFNEVVMLLDLLADMPELRDDVLAWRPATYQEHFARSGLSGRSVVIAAYEASPPSVRQPFDAAVAALGRALAEIQSELLDADEAATARIGPARACALRPLLARADALIHGNADAVPAAA